MKDISKSYEGPADNTPLVPTWMQVEEVEIKSTCQECGKPFRYMAHENEEPRTRCNWCS